MDVNTDSHVLRACLGFRVTVSDCQRLQDELLFLGFLATSHGILVPQLGITPVPPALEVQSLKSWTTREVLRMDFLKDSILFQLEEPLEYSAAI